MLREKYPALSYCAAGSVVERRAARERAIVRYGRESIDRGRMWVHVTAELKELTAGVWEDDQRLQ